MNGGNGLERVTRHWYAMRRIPIQSLHGAATHHRQREVLWRLKVQHVADQRVKRTEGVTAVHSKMPPRRKRVEPQMMFPSMFNERHKERSLRGNTAGAIDRDHQRVCPPLPMPAGMVLYKARRYHLQLLLFGGIDIHRNSDLAASTVGSCIQCEHNCLQLLCIARCMERIRHSQHPIFGRPPFGYLLSHCCARDRRLATLCFPDLLAAIIRR